MAARVPVLAHDVLVALSAHRLVTSAQLHEMLAEELTLRRLLQVTAGLERDGLIARAPVAGKRYWAWWLTPAGAAVTEAAAARGYRLTPERARGPLQAHTLMANEIGLCFLRSARARGDDLGGWRHEVAHPLGPGARAERLIADAVLEYTVVSGRGYTWLCRFVEVDRATSSLGELAAKLESYRRLAAWPEGWRSYPRWPGVLVVTDGRSPDALARRIAGLAALVAARGGTGRLGALAATLGDLRAHGPLAAVWAPLEAPGPKRGLV